jgi:hypothetical protein
MLTWSKTLKAGMLDGPHTKTDFGAGEDSTFSKASEEVVRSGRQTNVKRVKSSGMANGCVGGTKLRRANPMSGSGMKQGRQTRGG